MPKWLNTQRKGCWLHPNDQIQRWNPFKNQEGETIGSSSLLHGWHWVLFEQNSKRAVTDKARQWSDLGPLSICHLKKNRGWSIFSDTQTQTKRSSHKVHHYCEITSNFNKKKGLLSPRKNIFSNILLLQPDTEGKYFCCLLLKLNISTGGEFFSCILLKLNTSTEGEYFHCTGGRTQLTAHRHQLKPSWHETESLREIGRLHIFVNNPNIVNYKLNVLNLKMQ